MVAMITSTWKLLAQGGPKIDECIFAFENFQPDFLNEEVVLGFPKPGHGSVVFRLRLRLALSVQSKIYFS